MLARTDSLNLCVPNLRLPVLRVLNLRWLTPRLPNLSLANSRVPKTQIRDHADLRIPCGTV